MPGIREQPRPICDIGCETSVQCSMLSERLSWPINALPATTSPMMGMILGPSSTTCAKKIMHTVRYTDMAPDRFKIFWKD